MSFRPEGEIPYTWGLTNLRDFEPAQGGFEMKKMNFYTVTTLSPYNKITAKNFSQIKNEKKLAIKILFSLCL